jgi:hypothetical protein
MGFFRRLLGAGGNDANAPSLVVVPKWGPDGYSQRMAVLGMLRGNAFSPANIGPGVRPAPNGSAMERTRQTAQLPPQQQFRGVSRPVTDPALRTTRPTAQFPSTNVAINPVLFGLAKPQTSWSGWRGEADGE